VCEKCFLLNTLSNCSTFSNCYGRNAVVCKRLASLMLLKYKIYVIQSDTTLYFIRYTGCPRRNVPDFGNVFLMLKYTDITQNTYVQSWTVTEIMAREKCGLLAGPCTVPVSWQPYPCPSSGVVSYYGNSAHAHNKLFMYFLLGDKAVQVSAWHSCHV